MNRVVLHLGSNLGDREMNLSLAIDKLDQVAQLTKISQMYETEAWGVENQDAFLNQALELTTNMEPHDLFVACERIMNQFPLRSPVIWSPRHLDIDVIFFNELIMDEVRLKIPHPRMHQRNFVLIPLLEIVPYWRHPKLGLTVEELYRLCHDPLEVVLIS